MGLTGAHGLSNHDRTTVLVLTTGSEQRTTGPISAPPAELTELTELTETEDVGARLVQLSAQLRDARRDSAEQKAALEAELRVANEMAAAIDDDEYSIAAAHCYM